MDSNKNKTYGLVMADEEDQLSRILLGWLNQFPGKPDFIDRVDYEFLDKTTGMAMSTVQSTYKTKLYILGGYEAQYQFKIIYRIQPGDSNNKRLEADELLNRYGDWAANRTDKPVLGSGKRVLRIECNTRSSLFARYDDGSEDHQILLNMIYEVV